METEETCYTSEDRKEIVNFIRTLGQNTTNTSPTHIPPQSPKHNSIPYSPTPSSSSHFSNNSNSDDSLFDFGFESEILGDNFTEIYQLEDPLHMGFL